MIMREEYNVYHYLALFFGLLVLVSSSPDSSARPTVNKPSVEPISQLTDARASYVRNNLDERLHEVLSGVRARKFEKWASKNDLDIISMHGVDESVSSTKFTTIEAAHTERQKQISYSPFPSNILDLSMVENPAYPERQYHGTPVADLDDQLPSKLDLLFRSIRLGVSFSPIICTSWLAMLSSKFRDKIWYMWITSCLASSGPAFIKWGGYCCII